MSTSNDDDQASNSTGVARQRHVDQSGRLVADGGQCGCPRQRRCASRRRTQGPERVAPKSPARQHPPGGGAKRGETRCRRASSNTNRGRL
jgi:hypothetical protein